MQNLATSCTCPPLNPNPAHKVGTWHCPVHHSPEYLARLSEVLIPATPLVAPEQPSYAELTESVSPCSCGSEQHALINCPYPRGASTDAA